MSKERCTEEEQEREAIRKFYDTQYVRANSVVWEEGIGKIFIQENDKLREYPVSPSKEYVPNASYEPAELWLKIQIQTLEWQQYIDNLAPSVKNLPIQERQDQSHKRMWKKKFNRELIRVLLDKARRFQ